MATQSRNLAITQVKVVRCRVSRRTHVNLCHHSDSEQNDVNLLPWEEKEKIELGSDGDDQEDLPWFSIQEANKMLDEAVLCAKEQGQPSMSSCENPADTCCCEARLEYHGAVEKERALADSQHVGNGAEVEKQPAQGEEGQETEHASEGRYLRDENQHNEAGATMEEETLRDALMDPEPPEPEPVEPQPEFGYCDVQLYM
eukprot:767670-Hanusia_phi.AAC.4